MKNMFQSSGKLMLVAFVYCSLLILGACGGEEEKKESETTIEQPADPRVIDTTKTDSAAGDKEGATRKIN